MRRTTKMKTVSWMLFVIFLFLITGCSSTVPTNHAPTIDSTPITNSVVDTLYTYYVEASDTDGDTLTYSLTSSPTGMTIDPSTGVINWTPDTVGDYNVTLQVSDGESFDTQSFILAITLTAITSLSPPTNVSASITFLTKVQITWDTVSGATHYQVYRAEALLGTKIVLSGWQTDTSYDDTSASGGITYYYWVKAATNSSGEGASDFSSPDTGHTIAVSLYLDPPTNVSASYNLPYRVRITWDAVFGASHYRIYRADSLLGTKFTLSGWQTGTSFDDYTVIPYDTYYYWVEAATSSSGDNASDYSYSSTGLATSEELDPPTNVLASDNLVGKVRITWDAAFGATHYQVYRRPQGTITKPTPISGWQTGTSYDDTSTTPGTYYYYQIKAAINGSGDYASSFSDVDTGHAIP